MAGGWPASNKKVSRGIVKGYCWLLVYIYTLHVYMIPARRKQLSLNFTNLLILSFFPYRTWDLHGIQPLPYSHDREYCLCLKTTTTTVPTLPTQTNTNLPRAEQLYWQTCSPSPPSSPPPASSSQPPTPSNSPIRAAQSVPPTIKLLPLAASTSFFFLFPHTTQTSPH